MSSSLLAVVKRGSKLLPVTKQVIASSRTIWNPQIKKFNPQTVHDELPPGYHVAEGEDVFELPPDKNLAHLAHDVELTDELRAKLAAKYNMRPEDYQPRNQGGMAIGDYPILPLENVMARDPNYDWDDLDARRNFGEPILHEAENFNGVYGLETRPYKYDDDRQWKFLFYGVVILFGGYILGEIFPKRGVGAPMVRPYRYPWEDIKNTKAKDENGKNYLIPPYRVVEHTFPKTAADYAGKPHH